MKAFTACPQCGQIVAVRRNGKVRFHRIKVWDDKTQTGRHARCEGTNQKVACQAAWKTYEAAEEAIGNQRQQSMKELCDAAKITCSGDHEEASGRSEAEEGGRVVRPGPALLLPGRDF